MSSSDQANGHGLRIAMVSPWDSSDRTAVSGTAFGLSGALESLGVDLVRIHGEPPRRPLGLLARGTKLRWLLTEGHAEDTWRCGIESTMARNAVARMRLARAGAVDGIVQLASDILIPRPSAPLVTYDDMTIRQAAAADYPLWRLAPRDLRWRIERQGAGYRVATACCTRSEWAADSIRSQYGIDSGKPKVVGVGRNRELGVAPDKAWSVPTFLFVGKDWERKNGDRVLEAFEAIRAERSDARLHLVGGHPRVDRPGVEVHGPLALNDKTEKARLDQLFARATCFVMPSLHEPLGISYAEAGSAGIPSIGTTNGGSREVIGPGGAVVDPLDLGQLIDAMRRFADPAEAAATGERALAHSQLYTWPRVAKRILNALGHRRPEADPEATFLSAPD